MRKLDRAVRDNRLPARGGEIVEDLMSAGTPLQQSWTQRCVAATASQHFQTAFVNRQFAAMFVCNVLA
jgi:hypothetical protein